MTFDFVSFSLSYTNENLTNKVYKDTTSFENYKRNTGIVNNNSCLK